MTMDRLPALPTVLRSRRVFIRICRFSAEDVETDLAYLISAHTE